MVKRKIYRKGEKYHSIEEINPFDQTFLSKYIHYWYFEKVHNPNFDNGEFAIIKNQSGLKGFKNQCYRFCVESR